MSNKQRLRMAAHAIRYGMHSHHVKVSMARAAWLRWGKQPWWALSNREHRFYRECGL